MNYESTRRYRSARKLRPKRRRALVWATLVLFGGYVGVTLIWPLPETQAIASQQIIAPGEAAQLQWPGYGQSALSAKGFGESLGSSGDIRSAPMASITKIVTALVVLDKKPITGTAGETITFSDEDVSLYNEYVARDGSVLPVSTGLSLSQYQTLQAVLIASANNYADSLAIWAYGSMPAYLEAADAYLEAHNLALTVVADASGFSPESRSSAVDLVRLGTLALANTTIADIVRQETATLPNIGQIQTTNQLLGSAGVIGIKTGTTDEAGACLLYAVEIIMKGSTIVVVGATLGASNHQILAQDTTALLVSVREGFHVTTVTDKPTSFANYTTAWSATSDVIPTDTMTLTTWSDRPISQSITTQPVATDLAGAEIGKAQFTSDSQSVQTALMLADDLSPPSLWWRFTHPLELIFS